MPCSAWSTDRKFIKRFILTFLKQQSFLRSPQAWANKKLWEPTICLGLLSTMFPWDLHKPSPSPEPPSKDSLPFSQRDPLQPRYFFYQAHGPGWEHKSRTSQESELCSGNKPQWFKTTKLISHSYYTSSAEGLWGDSGPQADQRHSFGIASMMTKAVRICLKVTHITSAPLSLAKPCTHWCLRAHSWPAWQ